MYLDQLPEAEKPAFVELPRLKAERTATVYSGNIEPSARRFRATITDE